MNNMTFADLIDVASLKMIQDSFSRYTGLALCVVDSEGNLVVASSGSCDFCLKTVRSSKIGDARCYECDKINLLKAAREAKAFAYTCHTGMTDAVIPIIFENRIIGAILAGQVRTEEFDEEKYRRYAIELGIDPELYVQEARKVKYIPKEQMDELVQFLSEFAEALSNLAYTNYRAIKDSRKMEIAARSQTGVIMDLIGEIRSGMQNWIDEFCANVEKYRDIPQVMEETDAILASANEVFRTVGGAVDYISMSKGTAEYIENVYDARELIQSAISMAENETFAAKVSVTADIDGSVPALLAGNSGRIGQIVSKLISNVIKFAKDGAGIRIKASCAKMSYSVVLTIGLDADGISVTDREADALQKIIESGGAGGSVYSSISNLDFPLLMMLARQMSGDIKLDHIDDKSVSVRFIVPQLDGAEKTV